MKKAFFVFFTALFLFLSVSIQKIYAVDVKSVEQTSEISIRNLWADILSGLLIGVSSGVISSFLFLNWLKMRRPEIDISTKISKVYDSKKAKHVYQIKVVNKTSRPIINVRVQLSSIDHSVIQNKQGKGSIKDQTTIPLRKDSVSLIKEYKKADTEGDYACRFTIEADLEDPSIVNLEAPNTYLEFSVFATDSESNLSTVVQQCFWTKSCIQNGSFGFGESLEIS